MFLKLGIFIILFSLGNTYASWDGAKNTFERKSKAGRLKGVLNELIEGGYYYSSLPLMKEYLTNHTKNLDSRIDRNLSRLIKAVGIKHFETLPTKFLIRSKSDNMRYILAKKYLRDKKYSKALSYLGNINSRHPIYPFAKNMQGTIFSITKNYKRAKNSFRECEKSSIRLLRNQPNSRRLKLNRDYCVAGKARTSFAAREFENSSLLYLDIPKSSHIWPEILFEEAWTSYYEGNYNRALGKLVSYKAPVFQSYFNPEVEVLTALSYLKLCLYADAKKTSDSFYDEYLADTRKLRNFILKAGKRYRKYYELMLRYEQYGKTYSPLFTRLLDSILKEESFSDLKLQLSSASKEYHNIRSARNSRFKRFVIQNISDSILTHKRIIGAHIRAKLVSMYAQLYRSFEGMSYIKLEVLAQKKARLYSFEDKKEKRGDVKYIERNEKQYFWDFNGEFWADELGDYVFALKSEC